MFNDRISTLKNLFSENETYELADWVKVKEKQIKSNEYCETDNSDEKKNCDSDEHLNCDWKGIEF